MGKPFCLSSCSSGSSSGSTSTSTSTSTSSSSSSSSSSRDGCLTEAATAERRWLSGVSPMRESRTSSVHLVIPALFGDPLLSAYVCTSGCCAGSLLGRVSVFLFERQQGNATRIQTKQISSSSLSREDARSSALDLPARSSLFTAAGDIRRTSPTHAVPSALRLRSSSGGVSSSSGPSSSSLSPSASSKSGMLLQRVPFPESHAPYSAAAPYTSSLERWRSSHSYHLDPPEHRQNIVSSSSSSYNYHRRSVGFTHSATPPHHYHPPHHPDPHPHHPDPHHPHPHHPDPHPPHHHHLQGLLTPASSRSNSSLQSRSNRSQTPLRWEEHSGEEERIQRRSTVATASVAAPSAGLTPLACYSRVPVTENSLQQPSAHSSRGNDGLCMVGGDERRLRETVVHSSAVPSFLDRRESHRSEVAAMRSASHHLSDVGEGRGGGGGDSATSPCPQADAGRSSEADENALRNEQAFLVNRSSQQRSRLLEGLQHDSDRQADVARLLDENVTALRGFVAEVATGGGEEDSPPPQTQKVDSASNMAAMENTCCGDSCYHSPSQQRQYQQRTAKSSTTKEKRRNTARLWRSFFQNILPTRLGGRERASRQKCENSTANPATTIQGRLIVLASFSDDAIRALYMTPDGNVVYVVVGSTHCTRYSTFHGLRDDRSFPLDRRLSTNTKFVLQCNSSLFIATTGTSVLVDVCSERQCYTTFRLPDRSLSLCDFNGSHIACFCHHQHDRPCVKVIDVWNASSPDWISGPLPVCVFQTELPLSKCWGVLLKFWEPHRIVLVKGGTRILIYDYIQHTFVACIKCYSGEVLALDGSHPDRLLYLTTKAHLVVYDNILCATSEVIHCPGASFVAGWPYILTSSASAIAFTADEGLFVTQTTSTRRNSGTYMAA